MQNPDQKTTDRMTAHGAVRGPGGAPTRSGRFAWRDPESGERLEVELQGCEAFLAALEATGFERIEEAGPDVGDGVVGKISSTDFRPRAGSRSSLPRLAIDTPRLRGSA